MLTRPIILLIFAITLLTTAEALCILGGQTVANHPFKNRVHSIDTRIGDTSIVCTAASINSKHILTAAHCLNHIISSTCKPLKEDCEQIILINKKKVNNFKFHIHPNYKAKASTSSDYLKESNFDIAIISFEEPLFSDFFEISTTHSSHEPKSSLSFFGRGMSQLKKIFVNEQESFLETNRGHLKTTSYLNMINQNGLIYSFPSIISFKTDQSTLSSGQILKSDSGGPLLNKKNQIIGIARNYTLSENSVEASSLNSSNIIVTKSSLSLQSFFTSITNEETLSFIKQKMADPIL